mgnify:CR=1 FL=1
MLILWLSECYWLTLSQTEITIERKSESTDIGHYQLNSQPLALAPLFTFSELEINKQHVADFLGALLWPPLTLPPGLPDG